MMRRADVFPEHGRVADLGVFRVVIGGDVGEELVELA